MKKLRPSIVRAKADAELVRKVLAKNNGLEYSIDMNPFDIGTLRYDRFERHYKNWRIGWLDTEARFRDLCEVYGGLELDRVS